MEDFRKPRFSIERWGFLLALVLMILTGIPEASASPNLYLPLIMKPPICDPALTLTSGNIQILFGTPGDDHICEYGFGGNASQYADGGAGNDTIYQDCRGADTCSQTGILGDGNKTLTQYGAKGNSTMYAEGGEGNQVFNQFGGSGDDNIMVNADTGKSWITQIAGAGNDTMEVTGSTGDDNITLDAGDGNDTITYNVTAGTDIVHIDGGAGDDILTINKNQQSVREDPLRLIHHPLEGSIAGFLIGRGHYKDLVISRSHAGA